MRKQMKIHYKVFLSIVFLSLNTNNFAIETVQLKFPIVDIHSDYYYNLLEAALDNAGIPNEIERIELPAQRAKKYIEQGEIDIINMVQSDERDLKFIPIPIGLTNGLIANRVLLIPKGDSWIYENIHTLNDFRNLNKVVGMGAKWFDVKVWKANNLPVFEFANEYTLLFGMLASKTRGIDYYSTGVNEAVDEIEKYGSMGLEIEPRLMLVYERDFIFYLSPNASGYKHQIESALKHAQDSGLIEKMVREYWEDDFQELNYDGRLKIYLETPR
jgi:hypothetical protein